MDNAGWILISVTFFVCTLALLAYYVLGIRRSSVFEPVSLFLFFVTLFTLPLPVRYCLTQVIEGNVSPYLEQFASFIAVSVILTAISLITFVGAYYSSWAARLGRSIPALRDRSVRGTGVGILTLVAISAMLIYFLTESLGGIVAFLLLGYKSSEETFGRGYLAVGFPWLVVATLALFDRYAVTRRVPDLLLGSTMLLVNLVVFGITGNRAMLMYLAVSVMVFVNFRIRKISLSVLVPIAIAGFVVLNIMGTLRGSDYKNVEEFVEKTFTPSTSGDGQDRENFIYTLTIGEFVVPFETLPQVVRTIGVSEMPWLGASFVRAPIFLIPSFIYADRPPSIARWYMEKFYGGEGGINEGRQFFFLSEGYMNFGPLGVLLLAAVWGVLWGGLQGWMVRGRERFGTVLIYALLSAFMFRCIAGDFVTLLVGTTQQSLAAVLIILMVANMFYRGREPGGDAVGRN
jgi:hypothetical protein